MIKHYNPFEEMTFTYDRCFLCGDYLNDENETVEHVFPRWLQNKFDLWNQTLVLLNGTHIPYRNLIVPCCVICNNKYLNEKLEKHIELAVKGGYEKFKEVSEETVFKWLVKLSYGTLFKELSLKLNRADSNSGMIVNPHQLRKFSMLFTFLQSIRFETRFIGRVPWSIFVFKIEKPEVGNDYNGQDFISSNNYFLQMNDIGIISNLQDNGLLKDLFRERWSDFLEMELHPIQFRELCAEYHYKSLLMNRPPAYAISLPSNIDSQMLIISHALHGTNLFDKWDMKTYCELLEFHWKPWGIRFQDIYVDNRSRFTYLRNEDGSTKTF